MEPIWLPVLLSVTVVGIRVMGVRIGWLRALLVTWAGLATSGIFLTSLAGEDRSAPRVAAVIGLGLLAMLAWNSIVELLSSPRTEQSPTRMTNPVRSARYAIGRTRRKVEIAFVAARFGLGRYARLRAPAPRGSATGRAVRDALQHAGGVYVKLGQFLSTRPDLVSTEIAEQLRALQDNVGVVPAAAIRGVVASELGDAADALHAFDERAAAAASIAQVHRATLSTGETVAVKVQRPNVAARVAQDLDILTRLAERLERRTQWASDLQLARTVRGFAEAVTAELDFENEARNLRRMAAAVKRHPRFVVPKPSPGLARRRVVVMEWIEGSPLSDAANLLTERERAELARDLLRCFLDQLLVAGTYHADPHPGNLYRTESGHVALLDCGSIGLLDRRQRLALQDVLLAIAAQDAADLRRVLREITIESKPIDDLPLERALAAMLAQHLIPGEQLGVGVVAALMQIMRENGLAIKPMVAGAFRSLATLQSALEMLAPEFDLLGEAESAARTLANPLSFRSGGRSPVEELNAQLPVMLQTLAALPRRLTHIIESVERGQLAIGLHPFASERDRRFVNHLTAEFMVAFLTSAIGLIGAVLIFSAGPRIGTRTGSVLQAVGIGCVAVALLVLLSSLVTAIRRRQQRP